MNTIIESRSKLIGQCVRVSFALLFIFYTTIVYAAPRSLWEKRRSQINRLKESAEGVRTEHSREAASSTIDEALKKADNGLPLDPEALTVPSIYGTIGERYKGANGKLIIHIQDAHANYEGQKNIAAIIESLIPETGVREIYREGAFTDEDFTSIRYYGSAEARERAAEEFLKKAKITGGAYLQLTTSYPIRLLGLEEEGLYKAHKAAFWDLLEIRKKSSPYIEALYKGFKKLAARIYNKRLLELAEKKDLYENDKIDIADYYAFLYKSAKENEAPAYVFPNLRDFSEAMDIEKNIDIAKAGLPDAAPEERKQYERYAELLNNINVDELFKEQVRLENFLFDILAGTEEEKELVSAVRAVNILKKAVSVKLVPEEYNYFIEHEKDFDASGWPGMMIKEAKKYNMDISIPDAEGIDLKEVISIVKRFYGLAFKRDVVFIERLGEGLEKSGQDVTVLIAGGFHTPALTKLLREKGYSYIVVSPRITTKTNEALYIDALRR